MCLWEERRLRGCSTIWENGLVGPAGHPRRAPPALPPDAPLEYLGRPGRPRLCLDMCGPGLGLGRASGGLPEPSPSHQE